ncbi:MAG: CHAT domain-containing tetratricopeptide repeat protein [Acidobacteriota bacterium]
MKRTARILVWLATAMLLSSALLAEAIGTAVIEQPLAGGQEHRYALTSEADRYLHLRVEQIGIDLVVDLVDAAGEPLAHADSPHGNRGPEHLHALIPEAGPYEVVIKAPYEDEPAGRYRLELIEHRPPRPADHTRVLGERLQGEALASWASGGEARRRAIALFHEALPHWQTLEDVARQAETLTFIGNVHRSLGEAAEEAPFYRRALPLWRSLGNRQQEAQVLNSLGAANRRLGNSQEALESSGRAAELFRALGDQRNEAAALNSLAGIHIELGDLAQARRLFEDSLKLRRQVGDRRGEGRTLNNLGRVLQRQGEAQAAVAAFEQALELSRQTEDRLAEAGALNNLVAISSSLGRLRRSLDLYGQVLELARELDNRRAEAYALNNMGTLHKSLGESAEAIIYYRDALDLAQKLGDRRIEAKAVANIGWAYLADDQAEVALGYLERGLALAQELGEPRRRAFALINLSMAHSELGQSDQALQLARETVALTAEMDDRIVKAEAQRRLGEALRDGGQLAESLPAFHRALETWSALEFHSSRAGALFELSLAERRLGQLEDARRHLVAALETIDDLRTQVAVHDLRASFLAAKGDYAETYIDLLMELHQAEPRAGHQLTALEASERGRARTLLDALTEVHGRIRQGVEPALLEREAALRAALNERERQRVARLGEGADETVVANLLQQIQDLRSEHRAVEERIRSTSPRYAALTRPAPLGVGALQDLLDSNTTLLHYSLGEKRSFLWVLTDDSVESHRLPPRAKIEQAARRLYELLTAANVSRQGETAQQRQERLAAAEDDFETVAGSLSADLLGPAANRLTGGRVVIVAPGALQYIPFAALPAPGGNGRPMVADHILANLPSASVLAILRSEAARRQAPGGELAIVADPVFRREDRRVRQAKLAAAEALRSTPDDSLDFRRLYFSRQEARTIAAMVPPESRLEALDFAARRELAVDGALSDYRLVHFATHGVLNTDYPALSGLVLSLFDDQGEEREGFLRLHDIYNLELNADLVTLSACETALGRQIQGEGLIGLTRGFMYAGAPRVVASLWKVQDRATAKLMERFYAGMLQKNLPPAEALRAAQVSLWSSEKWSSPYYWAPFVFHGEWR